MSTELIYSLRRISFAYSSDSSKLVLKRLDGEFPPGYFYGVLGPNGSGKSTFLELLLGFKEPTEGELLFKGRDLVSYKRKEIAREVAFVPQQYYINFPFLVREVISMGRYPYLKRFSFLSRKDETIIENVLEEMELFHLSSRLITQLSGGEKQRVMIGRALAQNTQVMLLDEPTSSLDIKHSLRVLSILKKRVVNHGRTVICVFHNINEAASFCDYLLFLKKGSIIAFGRVEDVLTEDVLARVFEVEAKVYFEEELGCPQVIFKTKGERL